jgi:hypothetical protein
MSICTCYHNFRIDIVHNDLTIGAWVNCDIWMRDSSTVFFSTQKLQLRGQALQIYPQGYISMKANLISEGHSNAYQNLKISLNCLFMHFPESTSIDTHTHIGYDLFEMHKCASMCVFRKKPI